MPVTTQPIGGVLGWRTVQAPARRPKLRGRGAPGAQVGVGEPGKYKVILDADAFHFGGPGRVPHDPELFTQPEGEPGKPETNFNSRPHSFIVQAPTRSFVVYGNMDDAARWNAYMGEPAAATAAAAGAAGDNASPQPQAAVAAAAALHAKASAGSGVGRAFAAAGRPRTRRSMPAR